MEARKLRGASYPLLGAGIGAAMYGLLILATGSEGTLWDVKFLNGRKEWPTHIAGAALGGMGTAFALIPVLLWARGVWRMALAGLAASFLGPVFFSMCMFFIWGLTGLASGTGEAHEAPQSLGMMFDKLGAALFLGLWFGVLFLPATYFPCTLGAWLLRRRLLALRGVEGSAEASEAQTPCTTDETASESPTRRSEPDFPG